MEENQKSIFESIKGMSVEKWLRKDNKIGIDIFNGKYRGKYRVKNETFPQWLKRVSGNNPDLMRIIFEKKFLFGGRILSHRGLMDTQNKLTTSNCFVLERPEDSIESIFDCAKKAAVTFSRGGGVGIDISNLAPDGVKVNNSAKRTSGSTSFMDFYSYITGLIGQNGRRGALMLSIDCMHPDIEDFIKIKTDLNKVTKANISVRISDEFMQAVKGNKEITLKFYRPETDEKIEKKANAKELFHLMAEINWDYAEPGMLFWDRIEKHNMLANTKDFSFAGVNPCAEETLPAGGACLLGSINLSKMVSEDGEFNIDEFKNTVRIATIGLNEVLEEGIQYLPLPEQRDSVTKWRQIGLGVMGIADMLIKMGLTYGSEESIDFCSKIARIMLNECVKTSAMIAKEKGPYPGYDRNAVMSTKFYIENLDDDIKKLVEEYGLRNSQVLSIAPTGSLSTMLGISGGIEPIFANYYERKTESLHGKDVYYKVYTPIVKDYMDKNYITDDKDLPEFFITSPEIPYKNRIKMQAAWQQYIDASISSTVNLPYETTVEEVEDLYMTAWENGLKGITIFRDGCKRAGILTVHSGTNKKDNPESNQEDADKLLVSSTSNIITEDKTDYNETQQLKRGDIIKVDDNVIGKKRSIMGGCGKIHCEAFFDPVDGKLLEVYLSKGSKGGCGSFMVGLSRMISLAARGGIDIFSIVDQLNSCVACPSYAVRSATKKDTSKGSCCPSAVGNALLDMYNEMQNELSDSDNIDEEYDHAESKSEKKTEVKGEEHKYPLCPQCGERLYFEGGCNTCKSCGWSKCD